jgi:predicted DNA-binding protein
MSKRVYITLPDKVHETLEKQAKSQGRSTANLAAYLVEKGIESGQKTS